MYQHWQQTHYRVAACPNASSKHTLGDFNASTRTRQYNRKTGFGAASQLAAHWLKLQGRSILIRLTLAYATTVLCIFPNLQPRNHLTDLWTSPRTLRSTNKTYGDVTMDMRTLAWICFIYAANKFLPFCSTEPAVGKCQHVHGFYLIYSAQGAASSCTPSVYKQEWHEFTWAWNVLKQIYIYIYIYTHTSQEVFIYNVCVCVRRTDSTEAG